MGHLSTKRVKKRDLSVNVFPFCFNSMDSKVPFCLSGDRGSFIFLLCNTSSSLPFAVVMLKRSNSSGMLLLVAVNGLKV